MAHQMEFLFLSPFCKSEFLTNSITSLAIDDFPPYMLYGYPHSRKTPTISYIPSIFYLGHILPVILLSRNTASSIHRLPFSTKRNVITTKSWISRASLSSTIFAGAISEVGGSVLGSVVTRRDLVYFAIGLFRLVPS